MKSTYLKYFVLLAMAALIFLGSQDAEQSPFAHAHASLTVPFMNELNLDCSCAETSPANLLNPSAEPVNDYERKLMKFALTREYAKLGWCVDKKIRDTGPFTQGTYFGVHPAVRMYYSPRMMYWLTGDPKYWKKGKQNKRDPRTGPVPEGAIIIKEMFIPPGDLYDEMQVVIEASGECAEDGDYEKLLAQLIESYTIMVKDSKGSRDGWFWSNAYPKKGESLEATIESELTTYEKPLNSGFNLPCTRCHGSAELESNFASLNNIKGFNSGENLLEFQTDVSWKTQTRFNKFPISRIADGETCVKDSMTVAQLREMLTLPPLMRPWADTSIPGFDLFVNEHLREFDPNRNFATANPLKSVNPGFVNTYPQILGLNQDDFNSFPFQWADHVPPAPTDTDHYITSDNCLGCHGGLGGVPYDVTMFMQTGPKYGDGYNIAEYGEWRWSPMGLAGRDPIFYSMVESEMKFLEEDFKKGRLKSSLEDTKQAVISTCTSCHGAMGQRQLEKDAAKNPHLNPNFQVDYVYLTERLSSSEPEDSPYTKYGELAREGISCTVCHHINRPSDEQVQDWTPKADWLTSTTDKELAFALFHNNTGRYEEGPADELYGPYKDIMEKPMEHILGITPIANDFMSNSQLCGTCHTINLPNIGEKMGTHPILTAAEQNPILKEYDHSIEQATFLEWQNSAFGFKVDSKTKGNQFQSCQSCHMPNSFELVTQKDSINVPQLTTKIATIQDQDYADVENLLPTEDITVKSRTTYKRHELVGLNVFLLEMFDQFPDILGVDKQDYMTSSTAGNAMAIEHMVRNAQQNTVDIDVKLEEVIEDTLTVDVTVFNKVGHRFPSGVSFRRAFLEVLVMDGNDIIWGSGRTNAQGVIVDERGVPLPTEFLPNKDTYQPHYQTVRSQGEVQIYEELTQNQDHEFTSSFIHRVHHIKDNRLLPNGWRFSGNFKDQGPLMVEFMQSTDPSGVGKDPDYRDQGEGFVGKDGLKYKISIPKGMNTDNLSVKVTMYSQSIPPFWLHERFTTAPDGDATKRLYYMTSHLNLEGTYMKDWKLPLVSVERKYKKRS